MGTSPSASGRNPQQLQTTDCPRQLQGKLLDIAVTATKRKDPYDTGVAVAGGWDSDNCPGKNLKLTNSSK